MIPPLLLATTLASAHAAAAPVAHDDGSVRAAVAAALASTFDVAASDYIDGVAKDSSLACASDDDACWQKLAVAAGVDVIVVGTVDGTSVLLRALDTRDGSTHTARGPASDVAGVVRALFAPPAPTPSPTTTTTQHVIATTTTTKGGVSYPFLFAGGALAVVAVSCAAAGGVLESDANGDIEAWNRGEPISGDKFRARNAAEVGFFGCAGAAAVLAAGSSVVAFLE